MDHLGPGGQLNPHSPGFDSVFVFAIVLLQYATPRTDTARDPHIWAYRDLISVLTNNEDLGASLLLQTEHAAPEITQEVSQRLRPMQKTESEGEYPDLTAALPVYFMSPLLIVSSVMKPIHV